MIVVDASIAAAWFLDESHSPFAAMLLESDADLMAPDLMAAEVGSALVRGYRRNLISESEVSNGLAAIVGGLVTLHPTTPLLVGASAIACRHRCSIYDAAYLELAHQTGGLLATDDARMAEIARAISIRVHCPDDGPLGEQT